MECQFPAGPLVGDVTFTQKTNSIIDFVDRDNNYTATLYRCPKWGRRSEVLKCRRNIVCDFEA